MGGSSPDNNFYGSHGRHFRSAQNNIKVAAYNGEQTVIKIKETQFISNQIISFSL